MPENNYITNNDKPNTSVVTPDSNSENESSPSKTKTRGFEEHFNKSVTVLSNVVQLARSAALRLFGKNSKSRSVFLAKSGFSHLSKEELENLVIADFGKLDTSVSEHDKLIKISKYIGLMYNVDDKNLKHKPIIKMSTPIQTVDFSLDNLQIANLVSRTDIQPSSVDSFSSLIKHSDQGVESDEEKCQVSFYVSAPSQFVAKHFGPSSRLHSVFGQRNTKGNLYFQVGIISNLLNIEDSDGHLQFNTPDNVFINLIDLSDNNLTASDNELCKHIFKSIQYEKNLVLNVNDSVLTTDFFEALLQLDQDFVVDQKTYNSLVESLTRNGEFDPLLLKSLKSRKLDSELLNIIKSEHYAKLDHKQQKNYLALLIMKLSLLDTYTLEDVSCVQHIKDMLNMPSLDPNQPNLLFGQQAGMFKVFKRVLKKMSKQKSQTSDHNLSHLFGADGVNGFSVKEHPNLTFVLEPTTKSEDLSKKDNTPNQESDSETSSNVEEMSEQQPQEKTIYLCQNKSHSGYRVYNTPFVGLNTK